MKAGELESEKFTKYIGNRFLNINAIIFWGFLLYTVVAIDMDNIYYLAFFNVIFYAGVGYNANYFLLSNNYLQVKNHLWFWKKKTYRLNDIKEIIIEWPFKSSNAARIILNDNLSILNPAGSLWDKDWTKFIKDLENKGVKVQSIVIKNRIF
jgi:hypothetical protein